jgi:hypothetical protein
MEDKIDGKEEAEERSFTRQISESTRTTKAWQSARALAAEFENLAG